MKVMLDLPDPKFPCGQVVEVRGREFPYHLFVHITRVEAAGYWTFENGKVFVNPQDSVHTYTYVYQEGSRDAQGGLIRPGTIGVHDSSMEHEGEMIAWEKPIVSPDTADNLTQRKQGWALRLEPK